MIKYLFILIFSIVVENHAFLTTSTAVGPTTRNNPVLMRLLQTVDAATSDARLLDVSLQLLKSLCVCMRETLKAKQLESASFSGDTNSLQVEDYIKDPSKKVLDIYQNIYNKTCFDLKNEVASKVNKSAKISLDEEHEFMLKSDCGKTRIHDKIAIQKQDKVRNKNDTSLANILYQTFVKTRNYHRFSVRKYSLYRYREKKARVPDKHNIIVILTLYPANNTSPSINNCTNLAYTLNNTLHTNSPIDIDIIDARYGQKDNFSGESLTPEDATDCAIRSIYTFLLKCEKNGDTKVFKLMYRNNTIKVYIDVTSEPSHSDYTKICCNNNTDTPLCKIEFSNDFFESKEITTAPYTTARSENFKDTILKIKSLVKLYDKKLMKKKLKRSTTRQTFTKQNNFKSSLLFKDNNEQYTKKNYTSAKTMSIPNGLSSFMGSKEIWMNRIDDETEYEKINKDKTFVAEITPPNKTITDSLKKAGIKENKIANNEPTLIYTNSLTKDQIYPNEADSKLETSTEFINFEEKRTKPEKGNLSKVTNTLAYGILNLTRPQGDNHTERSLTYWEPTGYNQISTLPKNKDIDFNINSVKSTENRDITSTVDNSPLENTLEIVVTANNKQKKIIFNDLFAEPNLNEANKQTLTEDGITTNKNGAISKPSGNSTSKTTLFSICISLSKNTHHNEHKNHQTAVIKPTTSVSTLTIDDTMQVTDNLNTSNIMDSRVSKESNMPESPSTTTNKIKTLTKHSLGDDESTFKSTFLNSSDSYSKTHDISQIQTHSETPKLGKRNKKTTETVLERQLFLNSTTTKVITPKTYSLYDESTFKSAFVNGSHYNPNEKDIWQNLTHSSTPKLSEYVEETTETKLEGHQFPISTTINITTPNTYSRFDGEATSKSTFLNDSDYYSSTHYISQKLTQGVTPKLGVYVEKTTKTLLEGQQFLNSTVKNITSSTTNTLHDPDDESTFKSMFLDGSDYYSSTHDITQKVTRSATSKLDLHKKKTTETGLEGPQFLNATTNNIATTPNRYYSNDDESISVSTFLSGPDYYQTTHDISQNQTNSVTPKLGIYNEMTTNNKTTSIKYSHVDDESTSKSTFLNDYEYYPKTPDILSKLTQDVIPKLDIHNEKTTETRLEGQQFLNPTTNNITTPNTFSRHDDEFTSKSTFLNNSDYYTSTHDISQEPTQSVTPKVGIYNVKTTETRVEEQQYLNPTTVNITTPNAYSRFDDESTSNLTFLNDSDNYPRSTFDKSQNLTQEVTPKLGKFTSKPTFLNNSDFYPKTLNMTQKLSQYVTPKFGMYSEKTTETGLEGQQFLNPTTINITTSDTYSGPYDESTFQSTFLNGSDYYSSTHDISQPTHSFTRKHGINNKKTTEIGLQVQKFLNLTSINITTQHTFSRFDDESTSKSTFLNYSDYYPSTYDISQNISHGVTPKLGMYNEKTKETGLEEQQHLNPTTTKITTPNTYSRFDYKSTLKSSFFNESDYSPSTLEKSQTLSQNNTPKLGINNEKTTGTTTNNVITPSTHNRSDDESTFKSTLSSSSKYYSITHNISQNPTYNATPKLSIYHINTTETGLEGQQFFNPTTTNITAPVIHSRFDDESTLKSTFSSGPDIDLSKNDISPKLTRTTIPIIGIYNEKTTETRVESQQYLFPKNINITTLNTYNRFDDEPTLKPTFLNNSDNYPRSTLDNSQKLTQEVTPQFGKYIEKSTETGLEAQLFLKLTTTNITAPNTFSRVDDKSTSKSTFSYVPDHYLSTHDKSQNRTEDVTPKPSTHNEKTTETRLEAQQYLNPTTINMTTQNLYSHLEDESIFNSPDYYSKTHDRSQTKTQSATPKDGMYNKKAPETGFKEIFLNTTTIKITTPNAYSRLDDESAFISTFLTGSQKPTHSGTPNLGIYSKKTTKIVLEHQQYLNPTTNNKTKPNTVSGIDDELGSMFTFFNTSNYLTSTYDISQKTTHSASPNFGIYNLISTSTGLEAQHFLNPTTNNIATSNTYSPLDKESTTKPTFSRGSDYYSNTHDISRNINEDFTQKLGIYTEKTTERRLQDQQFLNPTTIHITTPNTYSRFDDVSTSKPTFLNDSTYYPSTHDILQIPTHSEIPKLSMYNKNTTKTGLDDDESTSKPTFKNGSDYVSSTHDASQKLTQDVTTKLSIHNEKTTETRLEDQQFLNPTTINISTQNKYSHFDDESVPKSTFASGSVYVSSTHDISQNTTGGVTQKLGINNEKTTKTRLKDQKFFNPTTINITTQNYYSHFDDESTSKSMFASDSGYVLSTHDISKNITQGVTQKLGIYNENTSKTRLEDQQFLNSTTSNITTPNTYSHLDEESTSKSMFASSSDYVSSIHDISQNTTGVVTQQLGINNEQTTETRLEDKQFLNPTTINIPTQNKNSHFDDESVSKYTFESGSAYVSSTHDISQNTTGGVTQKLGINNEKTTKTRLKDQTFFNPTTINITTQNYYSHFDDKSTSKSMFASDSGYVLSTHDISKNITQGVTQKLGIYNENTSKTRLEDQQFLNSITSNITTPNAYSHLDDESTSKSMFASDSDYVLSTHDISKNTTGGVTQKLGMNNEKATETRLKDQLFLNPTTINITTINNSSPFDDEFTSKSTFTSVSDYGLDYYPSFYDISQNITQGVTQKHGIYNTPKLGVYNEMTTGTRLKGQFIHLPTKNVIRPNTHSRSDDESTLKSTFSNSSGYYPHTHDKSQKFTNDVTPILGIYYEKTTKTEQESQQYLNPTTTNITTRNTHSRSNNESTLKSTFSIGFDYYSSTYGIPPEPTQSVTPKVSIYNEKSTETGLEGQHLNPKIINITTPNPYSRFDDESTSKPTISTGSGFYSITYDIFQNMTPGTSQKLGIYNDNTTETRPEETQKLNQNITPKLGIYYDKTSETRLEGQQFINTTTITTTTSNTYTRFGDESTSKSTFLNDFDDYLSTHDKSQNGAQYEYLKPGIHNEKTTEPRLEKQDYHYPTIKNIRTPNTYSVDDESPLKFTFLNDSGNYTSTHDISQKLTQDVTPKLGKYTNTTTKTALEVQQYFKPTSIIITTPNTYSRHDDESTSKSTSSSVSDYYSKTNDINQNSFYSTTPKLGIYKKTTTKTELESQQFLNLTTNNIKIPNTYSRIDDESTSKSTSASGSDNYSNTHDVSQNITQGVTQKLGIYYEKTTETRLEDQKLFNITKSNIPTPNTYSRVDDESTLNSTVLNDSVYYPSTHDISQNLSQDITPELGIYYEKTTETGLESQQFFTPTTINRTTPNTYIRFGDESTSKSAFFNDSDYYPRTRDISQNIAQDDTPNLSIHYKKTTETQLEEQDYLNPLTNTMKTPNTHSRSDDDYDESSFKTTFLSSYDYYSSTQDILQEPTRTATPKYDINNKNTTETGLGDQQFLNPITFNTTTPITYSRLDNEPSFKTTSLNGIDYYSRAHGIAQKITQSKPPKPGKTHTKIQVFLKRTTNNITPLRMSTDQNSNKIDIKQINSKYENKTSVTKQIPTKHTKSTFLSLFDLESNIYNTTEETTLPTYLNNRNITVTLLDSVNFNMSTTKGYRTEITEDLTTNIKNQNKDSTATIFLISTTGGEPRLNKTIKSIAYITNNHSEITKQKQPTTTKAQTLNVSIISNQQHTDAFDVNSLYITKPYTLIQPEINTTNTSTQIHYKDTGAPTENTFFIDIFDTNSTHHKKSKQIRTFTTIPYLHNQNLITAQYKEESSKLLNINSGIKTKTTATKSSYNSKTTVPKYSTANKFKNNSNRYEMFNTLPYSTNQYHEKKINNVIEINNEMIVSSTATQNSNDSIIEDINSRHESFVTHEVNIPLANKTVLKNENTNTVFSIMPDNLVTDFSKDIFYITEPGLTSKADITLKDKYAGNFHLSSTNNHEETITNTDLEVNNSNIDDRAHTLTNDFDEVSPHANEQIFREISTITIPTKKYFYSTKSHLIAQNDSLTVIPITNNINSSVDSDNNLAYSTNGLKLDSSEYFSSDAFNFISNNISENVLYTKNPYLSIDIENSLNRTSIANNLQSPVFIEDDAESSNLPKSNRDSVVTSSISKIKHTTRYENESNYLQEADSLFTNSISATRKNTVTEVPDTYNIYSTLNNKNSLAHSTNTTNRNNISILDKHKYFATDVSNSNLNNMSVYLLNITQSQSQEKTNNIKTMDVVYDLNSSEFTESYTEPSTLPNTKSDLMLSSYTSKLKHNIKEENKPNNLPMNPLLQDKITLPVVSPKYLTELNILQSTKPFQDGKFTTAAFLQYNEKFNVLNTHNKITHITPASSKHALKGSYQMELAFAQMLDDNSKMRDPDKIHFATESILYRQTKDNTSESQTPVIYGTVNPQNVNTIKRDQTKLAPPFTDMSVSNMISKIKKILKSEPKSNSYTDFKPKDTTTVPYMYSEFSIPIPTPDNYQNQNTNGVESVNYSKFSSAFPGQLYMHTLRENKTNNDNISNVDNLNKKIKNNSFRSSTVSNDVSLLKNEEKTFINTIQPLSSTIINTADNKSYVNFNTGIRTEKSDLDQISTNGLNDIKHDLDQSNNVFKINSREPLNTEVYDKTLINKSLFVTTPSSSPKNRNDTNKTYTCKSSNISILYEPTTNNISVISELNKKTIPPEHKNTQPPYIKVYDTTLQSRDLTKNISEVAKHNLNSNILPTTTIPIISYNDIFYTNPIDQNPITSYTLPSSNITATYIINKTTIYIHDNNTSVILNKLEVTSVKPDIPKFTNQIDISVINPDESNSFHVNSYFTDSSEPYTKVIVKNNTNPLLFTTQTENLTSESSIHNQVIKQRISKNNYNLASAKQKILDHQESRVDTDKKKTHPLMTTIITKTRTDTNHTPKNINKDINSALSTITNTNTWQDLYEVNLLSSKYQSTQPYSWSPSEYYTDDIKKSYEVSRDGSRTEKIEQNYTTKNVPQIVKDIQSNSLSSINIDRGKSRLHDILLEPKNRGTQPFSLNPDHSMDNKKISFSTTGDSINDINQKYPTIYIPNNLRTDYVSDNRPSDTKPYTFGFTINDTDNKDSYEKTDPLLVKNNVKIHKVSAIDNDSYNLRLTNLSGTSTQGKNTYLRPKQNKTNDLPNIYKTQSNVLETLEIGIPPKQITTRVIQSKIPKTVKNFNISGSRQHYDKQKIIYKKNDTKMYEEIYMEANDSEDNMINIKTSVPFNPTIVDNYFTTSENKNTNYITGDDNQIDNIIKTNLIYNNRLTRSTWIIPAVTSTETVLDLPVLELNNETSGHIQPDIHADIYTTVMGKKVHLPSYEYTYNTTKLLDNSSISNNSAIKNDETYTERTERATIYIINSLEKDVFNTVSNHTEINKNSNDMLTLPSKSKHSLIRAISNTSTVTTSNVPYTGEILNKNALGTTLSTIATSISNEEDIPITVNKSDPFTDNILKYSSQFELTKVNSANHKFKPDCPSNVKDKVHTLVENIYKTAKDANETALLLNVCKKLSDILNGSKSYVDIGMENKTLIMTTVRNPSKDHNISSFVEQNIIINNNKSVIQYSGNTQTQNNSNEHHNQVNKNGLDDLFTKTIFITRRIMTGSGTETENERKIVKPKVIYRTNLSKFINVVRVPTYSINNKLSPIDNNEKLYLNFSNSNQSTNLQETTNFRHINTRRATNQPAYLELQAKGSINILNNRVKGSKQKHQTTKSIIYNTYKALTEEELTLPPDVKKIITTFSTIYTKDSDSERVVKTQAKRVKIDLKPKFLLKPITANKLNKIQAKYNTTNESIDRLIDDTLHNFTNNTQLHPIEKVPIETQWKLLHQINPNRKRPIMMMNTDDFLSFRRKVTRKAFYDKMKHNKLPVTKYPIQALRVTKLPKRIMLRPRFHSFEDFQMNPVVPAIPKNIIMQGDRNLNSNNFKIIHKPGQSRREMVGEVRTKLESLRRSMPQNSQKRNFQPVIDVPYYMPSLMKSYFLRDKVESVRSFIYNEEKDKLNGRRHFKSPPNIDNSGIPVEASDALEQVYISAGRSHEHTDLPTPRVTRPKKTIFFLSPTIPYNRYF